MSRYYNSSNSSSFDIHHQRQVQHPAESSGGFSSVGSQEKQHYSSHRSNELQQQLSSNSHQPPHVGAGITSGISSTSAAPSGINAGYPGPLLGYHYPHPVHPYPNNLYTANYYHPFNPAALNYAQTQKQTHSVPSYPA